MNDKEVSTTLGVSVATVSRWRLLKQGSQFYKIGASVRYQMADVTSWLESRPSGGERREVAE